eukprot:ANDGO_06936.mRNA.1 hypothetical protein
MTGREQDTFQRYASALSASSGFFSSSSSIVPSSASVSNSGHSGSANADPRLSFHAGSSSSSAPGGAAAAAGTGVFFSRTVRTFRVGDESNASSISQSVMAETQPDGHQKLTFKTSTNGNVRVAEAYVQSFDKRVIIEDLGQDRSVAAVSSNNGVVEEDEADNAAENEKSGYPASSTTSGLSRNSSFSSIGSASTDGMMNNAESRCIIEELPGWVAVDCSVSPAIIEMPSADELLESNSKPEFVFENDSFANCDGDPVAMDMTDDF